MSTRRDFIKKSLVAGASVAAATTLGASPLHALGPTSRSTSRVPSATEPFALKYAPSLGMFKRLGGEDFADQIAFCHDQGFRAVFDNNIMHRPEAEQKAIVKAAQKYGMEMGPFVLYADFAVKSFVRPPSEVREMLAKKMQEGIECAKRTGIHTALVVPGRIDENLFPYMQFAHVIDNLRYCCEIVEREGLVLGLEPLNRHNHPGLFLTDMPQAYAICRGVNSPSCKIIDDLYHQQISEGNLIPHIESCRSEITAFHLGDNPGRNEPLTGEINFRNIFRYLKQRHYDGILCMEHGMSENSREGELKVIEAYRLCDQ